MPEAWRVDHRRADAAELHASWPAVDADPGRPAVGVCRVTSPALVLGSTQPADVVDADRAAAAGLSVARRRSGGGAVLVTPDDPVWMDVWVPADHPRWHRDVARAFDWLGDAWVDALSALCVTGLSVHRGGTVACTRWSSLVCFGGVGTGEVVTADGRKVVGLAQRRTRAGAWFHGACVLRWDPAPLVDALALPADERHAAVRGLRRAVVGLLELPDAPDLGAHPGPAVADALVAALH